MSGRAGNGTGGRPNKLLPEETVTAGFYRRRDKTNPRSLLRTVSPLTPRNNLKSCGEIVRFDHRDEKAPSGCHQHPLIIAAATMSLTLCKSAQTVTMATGRGGERARSASLVRGRRPSGPLCSTASPHGVCSYLLLKEGWRKSFSYGLTGVMVSI